MLNLWFTLMRILHTFPIESNMFLLIELFGGVYAVDLYGNLLFLLSPRLSLHVENAAPRD